MVHTFPLTLPRYAFSPREVARPGAVWRAFQEAAVEGSCRQGWPPARYSRDGVTWIVRSMTVRHHRETVFGEPLEARTWVSRFRRGMITDREIRLAGPDGPVADATQEWVHVRGMRPARADAELLEAFAPTEVDEASVAMPDWDAHPGRTHQFRFDAWHTWMDPLAHANHPAYVDWCDEALSRVLAADGVDPARLAPVAETIKWKVGVTAPASVEIETSEVGRTSAGHAVTTHTVRTGDKIAARATLVRRLLPTP